MILASIMALETVLRYVRGIPCCGLSCCIRGPRPHAPLPMPIAPARPAAAPCRNGVPQRRASRYPALVGLLTNISERNAFFISPRVVEDVRQKLRRLEKEREQQTRGLNFTSVCDQNSL